MTTSLWRKNDAGQHICNACGLYKKLNRTDRPVEMKSTVVKQRRRWHQVESTPATGAQIQWHYEEAAAAVGSASRNLQFPAMMLNAAA